MSILIEWGNKLYGPYEDRAAALKDGFHVPPPLKPELTIDAKPAEKAKGATA